MVSGLLENVSTVDDALLIGLSLLVLMCVPLHALFDAVVLSLGLETAPITLNEKYGMFLLFLHDVVDVASVEVLDEVVFATHCLDALESLISCL